MAVSALGYLGFGVTDTGKWMNFAQDVVGFEVTETGEDGSVYLRMDELHHRFALHPGGNDDLAYIGLQTRNHEEFEATKRDLFEAGVEFVQGSPSEIANRMVRDMVKFTVAGIPLEVFYGPKALFEKPFHSPIRISGFKTGELGLGHLGVNPDDNEEISRVLLEGLGMKISDSLGGGERFFHCAGSSAREHTFVLGQPPTGGEKRIAHFMVELQTLDDVGSGLDRVEDNGVQLSRRLGKHTNDHMISFYMHTPSGFRMEYGWNGRTVDDATWNVQIYDKGAIWGHRPAANPVPAGPVR